MELPMEVATDISNDHLPLGLSDRAIHELSCRLRSGGSRTWLALSLLAACLGVVGCGANGILSDPIPASQTAATPVLSPGTGTYTGAQTITITDSTKTAAIYYSIDGSSPNANSLLYNGPFSIKANTTVNAIATAAGYTSSTVVSSTYTIVASQTAPPVLAPIPGSYSGAQMVTVTDATPGAAIYYTTDGTVPTVSSKAYTAPIAVTASETLSVLAVAGGYGNSVVVSGAYTINGPQAVAPVFSPGPGTYSSTQAVTLTDATVGASIYYTTDGTTPTPSSKLYTAPINVSTTEIISAIAGGVGFTSSPVASASFSVIVPAASAPFFTPSGGTYSSAQTVSINDALSNASIFYTTDGSQPTPASTPYTSPITVASSETLSAIAVAAGYSTSATARASYSIGNGATAPSAAYTFQNAQIIGGGFVDGIVMHPAQQGLMYARTDVGGAYRWNTATSQWVPLTDFLTRDQGNYIGIESLAVDPSDPNRLYLAGGTYADSFGTNGAVLVSTDQGATFTIVPLTFKLGSNDDGRFAGERLSVDPNLGSHLYLGSRLNGLWESKDYGTTWAQVTNLPVTGSSSANPATTGGVIFEDFIASSGAKGSVTPNVYVGVDDNTVSALYVTTDAGKTWAAVAGQPSGLFLNRGVVGSDGNLYLSYSNSLGPQNVTSGAIWRYTLPTTTNPIGVWKNITPVSTVANPGASYGFGSVTADPSRPGVIMATTLDLYNPHDDIFRSLDGGNSWIDLGGNQVRDGSLSPWLNFGGSSTGIGNWLVSIVIDPYNSNHVLYGTGETIWSSTNATAADFTPTSAGTTTAATVPTSWTVGALGLEETVVLSLISPPSGPNLLSGVRDIGGFTHLNLSQSPASGMQQNPLLLDTTSLDFAQSSPAMMVRVGDGAANNQNGAYSTDGGTSWTPFATDAGSVAGGGSIAIAADGSTLVWAPSDVGVSYSTDNGSTWNVSAGAPSALPVVSDRINPKKFYIFAPISGTLYSSTNAGLTFIVASTGLPRNGVLRASYAAEGDLWLATSSGLLHSTNSGATFTQVASTQEAYDVAFGMPATGSNYLSIYMYGRLAGVQGVFLSTDNANTWTPVTDPLHQYGYINVIAADPRVFGRVYLGTSGRGVIYSTATP